MENKTSQISERLLKIPSAAASDVLYEMGYPHQALSATIRGLDPKMKIGGPAFCIKGQSATGSAFKVLKGVPNPAYEAFRKMYKDCVVVIDTGGHDICAIIGENVGIAAKVRGCRGFVIDGGVRDAQEFIDMEDFSVFAKFIGPVSTKGRWEYLEFEKPITIPGQTCSAVLVNPGDFILGDMDGVLVIPKDLIETVMEYAEELIRVEDKMRKELWKGVDREEVYKKYNRFAHIKKS